jgi:hypothetical protein
LRTSEQSLSPSPRSTTSLWVHCRRASAAVAPQARAHVAPTPARQFSAALLPSCPSLASLIWLRLRFQRQATACAAAPASVPLFASAFHSLPATGAWKTRTAAAAPSILTAVAADAAGHAALAAAALPVKLVALTRLIGPLDNWAARHRLACPRQCSFLSCLPVELPAARRRPPAGWPRSRSIGGVCPAPIATIQAGPVAPRRPVAAQSNCPSPAGLAVSRSFCLFTTLPPSCPPF